MTGSGTEGDPWIVGDVDDLQAVGDQITYLLSEHYKLGSDIDASETETWNINNGFIPIGFYGTPFSGTFDGAEYTISDLYINRTSINQPVGLFGETQTAIVKDVTLADASIIGEDNVGVLIGEAYGTTVSGCHSTGSVKAIDNYVGGIVGFANHYGGIPTTITDCSSSCAVSGDDYAGGVNGYSITATISECYASGAITTTDDYAGGIVGTTFGTVSNCYARGSVTGDQYVGGLIGLNYGTVSDCFSTGAPTGNNDVGGLIGANSGTATNCFWDTTTSGTETSDGGTGYATATMLLFATYGNATWDIGQADATRNDGYPFLSWEIDESATVWQIFGEGTYSITTSANFPDLMDNKGRHPKNARVRAYRVDTHSLVDEQYTDHNGTVTFSELPAGVDVIFLATWGGISQPDKQRWFFLQVYDVDGGGTGAGTAAGALSNLGLGTEDSPQFTAVNLGHASDTTITRVDSGRIAIEGVNIVRSAGTVADNEIVRFSGTTGDLVK